MRLNYDLATKNSYPQFGVIYFAQRHLFRIGHDILKKYFHSRPNPLGVVTLTQWA